MPSKDIFEKQLNAWIEKWENRLETIETELSEDKHVKIDHGKLANVKARCDEVRKYRDLLKQTDHQHKEWQKIKTRVDDLMGDITKEFRETLSYFH